MTPASSAPTRRLMLALADVLAENPRTATGLAIADLRSLAAPSPGQVSRWIRTTKAGTSQPFR